MKRKEEKIREREILHNYMEILALNHKEIEPATMTDSICKLHSELNPTTNIGIKFCGIILAVLLANLVVSFFVLIRNFFRSKV